ncbi:hypothetical protein EV401DRAFT_2031605 [Pisolithus croceorrhizus]|nr:hypothetical protein EV401DRAFT_2031605 [Pisolithus croceorrhizus]
MIDFSSVVVLSFSFTSARNTACAAESRDNPLHAGSSRRYYVILEDSSKGTDRSIFGVHFRHRTYMHFISCIFASAPVLRRL